MPEDSTVKAREAPAEWVSIDRLMPWVGNPRKNDHAVKKLADSIKRFGFGAPVVARRENGEIIAGHTRVKAAKKLGMKEVPVRYLDLSEREAHLLALADNKLGEMSEWSEELARQLDGFSLSEVEAAGWGPKELSKLLEDVEAPVDTSARLGGLVFSVVVECSDESQQAELMAKLEAEGFTCKPLIS